MKWLHEESNYQDIPGYCRSVATVEIAQSDYSLYPGEYIGIDVSPEDIKDKTQAAKVAIEAAEEIR